MHPTSRQSAFTLIEMSVAITIIAVIVSGVLVAQNIIRASELRSLVTDANKYIAAARAFQDKYTQLPGDFSGATAIWGAQHATPANCRTTASTAVATCDGNGDGHIDTMDAGVTYSEYHRAWQHLANANFIGGQYSGVGNPSIAAITPGANAPLSKISGVGFRFSYNGPLSGNASFFDANYGNILMILASNNAAALSATDAYSIDSKTDDGKPGTGLILGVKTTSAWVNCATTSVASTALYNVANSGVTCPLVFITGF